VDDLERLYELLYLLPVGVVSFTDDGSVESANPMAVRLLNPFVQPSATSNAYSLLAPIAPNLADVIAAHTAGAVVIGHQRTALTPESIVELSVHRPRPGYYIAVLSDVSELVRREQELRRERDRIRIIVDMVREYAIYSIDLRGTIDSWNASGARLFCRDADDVVGRSLGEIVSIDNLPDALDAAAFAGWHRIEGWTIAGPAGSFYTDTMISTLVDDLGRPDGFIVITRDATEALRREEALRAEADTDPLTKLANRRGFEMRAVRLINACNVNGTPATILMIDIDHFKAINDTHGHDGGDAVLCRVSAMLGGQLRSIDLVGRLGGEEFAVLLPGADQAVGVRRADALRSAIQDLEIELRSRLTVHVTISIGVALYRDSLADTLHRADAAMYVAKQSGRNRVVTDGNGDHTTPSVTQRTDDESGSTTSGRS
jgi:diguanylate cyclase (GGDEF)-like protein